jgi:hypothetical protein
MPIARFSVPSVTRQRSLSHSGSEIENLESCVIGGREEFGIVGAPGEVPDSVVMRIIHSLDVIKIRPPVFYIAFLAARNEPIMAVRPSRRSNTRLVLIVMSLFILSVRLDLEHTRFRNTHIHHGFEIEGGSIPQHKFSGMPAS